MYVEIKIDSGCGEPRIVVYTDKVTDEIKELIGKISGESPRVISGFKDDILKVLEQSDILRIYAASGKVFAVTADGEYTLRLRLYEAEERLDRRVFVRISNSEIINIRKAEGFDLSLAGTIRVTMSDGAVSYVSRRYVTKIKQVLGL